MDTNFQEVYDENSSWHFFPIRFAEKLEWTQIPLDGYYQTHPLGLIRSQVKLNCAPWKDVMQATRNDLASGFITLQIQLKMLLNRCPVLWENEEEKPVIDSLSGWSDVTISTMRKWLSGFLKETGFEILNAHILANVAALRLVPRFSHILSQFSELQRDYDREMPEGCDNRLHNRINQTV